MHARAGGPGRFPAPAVNPTGAGTRGDAAQAGHGGRAGPGRRAADFPLLRRLGGVARTALALAVILLAAGCVTDNAGPVNKPIPSGVTSVLRKGDSLNVAIIGVPDPTTNAVQIDEQGAISLPFIGTVPAAGSTTAELTERVRLTYLEKRIYTAVDVSVSVTERYVYVGGEVEHPGRIVWTSDLTAAKAIQAAGGFTPYAKEDKVGLVRDQVVYDINVKRAEREPAEDPRLEPGDSLQVQKTAF